VNGQLHAPAALPRAKNPGTHSIGGPQSRSGRGGEEKKWSYEIILEPALQEII